MIELFPFVLSHVEGFREDFQRLTKLQIETLNAVKQGARP